MLAIPVGALKPICEELIECDVRLRRIRNAVTVQTQAFQVWANGPAAELGWNYDENSVAAATWSRSTRTAT